ncbi:hypothetical protein ACN47E_005100 [Coniothyrium glycines]
MSNSAPPNLIATVESYLCPSLPVASIAPTDLSLPSLHLIPSPTLTKLRNVGSARIKDMRALGQSKQIISHIPIYATTQACANINDALYTASRLNADKFTALAILPSAMGQGTEAARELQRCITKYKFAGGMVGLRRGEDSILDDSFEELWSVADRFRTPIALREMWPSGVEAATYQRNLPDTVLAPFLALAHAAHSNSPLPFIHLYLAGVFDRYPSLRLILCHPGALPSLIPRIETVLSSIPVADKPKHVQEMSSMRALLEQIPMDRLLYASNYPFEENGKNLMHELRDSGFLSKDEYDMVAWGNAEVLFGWKTGGSKVIRK